MAGYGRVAGRCKVPLYLCQARVRRGDKEIKLGSFATAEEAALCVARSPEGQAAGAGKGWRLGFSEGQAPQLTRQQAPHQQARMEGLALRKSDHRAYPGYVTMQLPREEVLQRARDASIGAAALEIIYQAAEAATMELGAEVAAEVMAGITLGL